MSSIINLNFYNASYLSKKKMFNENLGKNVALRFKILLSFDMILYTSKILNFFVEVFKS